MKKIISLLAALLVCATSFVAMSGERPIRFAWGAEIGSDLDMTSHSMSSIGINAKFGLSWKWIRFLGLGAQGDFMVSNSDRSYPLYVNFRTDFSNRKRLLFMDLRGGMALTTFENLDQKTATYFSGGLGITLAQGKSFTSHIIVGYTYLGQDKCYKGEQLRHCPGLSMASLRLGVTFQTQNEREKPEVDLNPGIAATTSKVGDVSVRKTVSPFVLTDTPDFINLDANRIVMPDNADNAVWRELARSIINAQTNGTQVDIVHIGDSHVQAEMGTSRLREILQSQYGNGGRGLITAFKLAGTNQPVDYSITSQFPTDSQARLLKRPWDITPGFTGVASLSNRSNRITFKNHKEVHRFNESRVYTSDGDRLVIWPELQDSASFYAFPGERVFGVYTKNRVQPGIIYSTIGNNGACYSDYLLIDDFADNIAKFSPSLIILSMGTNEAYSTKTDDQVAKETRQLIQNLRTANPDALFMLWTPMECHKKDESDEFVVCQRLLPVRDVMIRVAREEGIPYWDFYEVAGGFGSAQKWVDAQMMNPRDHVHLLSKGYRLQGELAADALMNFLTAVAK